MQGSIEVVREELWGGGLPIMQHTGWRERFPWLVQGTTARGDDGFDLRLSGDAPVGRALARWRELRHGLGFESIACAGQVHGSRIISHIGQPPPGISIAESADGHATTTAGTLLAVSVADCIPVSIIDPARRSIAILHAGWRGVAGGIIPEGVRRLGELAGSEPASLFSHLGPAICHDCYEVGPEVFTALGLSAPATNQPIDLRSVAARQLLDLGVPAEQISVSAHCTRCNDSPFFSHRGGSKLRQVGVLGIREVEDAP